MPTNRNPYSGDSAANPFVVNPTGGGAAAPAKPIPSETEQDVAMPGQVPTTTKPRKRPNGAPADGSMGGGEPVGVQQGFASLVAVRCFACGQRGIMPLAALKPSLRCTCGSDDLDVDDEAVTSKTALELTEPVATYSYQAHDAGGNIITRTGLTWEQLCVQNGNLVVSGYLVTAKDNLGNVIDDIPPAWSLKQAAGENWCYGSSGHYEYDADGRGRHLVCSECGKEFTEVPGEVGPGHLPMHESANPSTTASKQAVAKVGTGDGYYVVNRNIPLAGPYVTASDAHQDMVIEGGTVVEYRKASDPRGRAQNPLGDRPTLSLGTGHISSVDKTAAVRKITQIAQGIKKTNPGMSTVAAFALAERTVERFPAVVEGNA